MESVRFTWNVTWNIENSGNNQVAGFCLQPYGTVKHFGIEYQVCRDFKHISRYKGLRQITHYTEDNRRFIALETTNPLISNAKFRYYDVTATEENHLDLIAYRFYGSAQYRWIISYFNGIEDVFTVREGQRLKILENLRQHRTIAKEGKM